MKGAEAPFMEIRSGDMCGARDRSLPPTVRDEGRQSVGNRKECRLRHDYASFPEERSLLPISLEVCPKGARTSDVFRYPTAARARSDLAANSAARMRSRLDPHYLFLALLILEISLNLRSFCARYAALSCA